MHIAITSESNEQQDVINVDDIPEAVVPSVATSSSSRGRGQHRASRNVFEAVVGANSLTGNLISLAQSDPNSFSSSLSTQSTSTSVNVSTSAARSRSSYDRYGYISLSLIHI